MKTFKALLIPFMMFTLASCDLFNKNSGEGNTVSRSEFRDAVNFRYKNLTFKGYEKENGKETQTAEVYFIQDGSMYQKLATDKQPFYWQRKEDLFYKIEKKESLWVVTSIADKNSYSEDDYSDDLGCVDMVYCFKNSYEKLEFDSKTKSYTGKITHEYFGSVDASLKFNGKNLTECKMMGTRAGKEFEYRIVVEKHGETSIDFGSLSYKNNIYVSGRTFNFVKCESTTDNPGYVDPVVITNNNSGSTLTFNEDGTFSLHMLRDFISTGEYTYTGRYSFDEVDRSLVISVDGQGNIGTITGTLELNPENYESGAILKIVSQLGFSVTFKI